METRKFPEKCGLMKVLGDQGGLNSNRLIII